MNAIDFAILAYTGIGAVLGFFKGFIAQMLNLIGGVVSIVATFLLFPRFGALISSSLSVPDAYSQPISLAVIFIGVWLIL